MHFSPELKQDHHIFVYTLLNLFCHMHTNCIYGPLLFILLNEMSFMLDLYWSTSSLKICPPISVFGSDHDG